MTKRTHKASTERKAKRIVKAALEFVENHPNGPNGCPAKGYECAYWASLRDAVYPPSKADSKKAHR